MKTTQPANPLDFKPCMQCNKKLPRSAFEWEYTCKRCVALYKQGNNLGTNHDPERSYRPNRQTEELLRRMENSIHLNGVNPDGTPIQYNEGQLTQRATAPVRKLTTKQRNHQILKLATELYQDSK